MDIKYRAYKNNKIIEWEELQEIDRWWEFDNLMAFIGLTDREGKEIYEGDIVRSEWGGQQKAIGDITEIVCLVRDGWLAGQENDGRLMAAEVIGNIYEDEKLLEDANH